MRRNVFFTLLIVLGAVVLLPPGKLQGAAFIRGAYYRLGDDDPAATPGMIGNDPTRDSFADMFDLARFASPRYSSNVPEQGPLGNKFSMTFANVGLGGPAFPSVYGRPESLPMIEQGYALEAWVMAGPTNLKAPDSITSSLIAYNGNPASNGFGFFMQDDNYLARVGTFERVLGPATIGQWHHLAYVQSLGNVSYYFDGNLVAETKSDPLPLAAAGGVWLGGFGDPLNDGQFLFNGWIDEVRYQSFNPLSAGAFDPTAFLITPVPEPATLSLCAAGTIVIGAFALAQLRRRRA